jgi:phenylacetate-CoA ligase
VSEIKSEPAEQFGHSSQVWQRVPKSPAFWFASKFLGASMTDALQTMKRVQWLSTEELLARSEKKLATLLHHAAGHVPFYRDFASNNLSTKNLSAMDSLRQLPVVNKKLYVKYPLEHFLANNIAAERRLLWSTSGSTGEPFSFYLDRKAMPLAFASHIFFDSWCGLRPFERYVRIVMPPTARPKLASGISVAARARWMIANRLQHIYESLTQQKICVMEVDRDQVESIYHRLEKFRPTFILGYTSTLALMAHELLDRRMRLSHPVRGVITIAETLTPQRREIIEAYFNAPIINRYGLREFGTWSAQNCSHAPTQLHINTEMVVCEILREDGSAASPGEKGRVVLTDLHNYARPFIRYDTGDLAIAGSGPCNCGRGFPLLDSLDGRSLESIFTKSGKEINPVVLGRYLREGGPSSLYSNHLESIKHYQLVQETPESVRLVVVAKQDFDELSRERLKIDLSRLLGEDMSIAVEVVDEIKCESSGKRPIIKVLQSAKPK